MAKQSDNDGHDQAACERCGCTPATVNVKHSENGQVRQLRLCEDCANQMVPPMAPMVDLLLSVGLDGEIGGAPSSASACPGCGMTMERIRQRHRLGCADCYGHFARELAPMLRDMQPGMEHRGKVPSRCKTRQKMAALDKELSRAVASQNFERAAVLRDRIRELDNDAGKDDLTRREE